MMSEKKLKARVGLIIGNFNILHPGHLRLLRFGNESCDLLIVAVNGDLKASHAAHLSEDDRMHALQCVEWVDKVFISNDSDSDIVRSIRPDIVIKGKEHESLENPESDVLNEYGGKIIFSSGESTFSSLNLLRAEFQSFNPHTIRLPRDFFHRHSISNFRLQKLVDQFKTKKVCVIGDLIVDEYIACEPLGMSQEDPTIVVTPVNSIKYVGGAGIVAAHASGLGADVSFLTVTGKDELADFVQDSLRLSGVNTFICTDNSRPTTLKQRFRSMGKSLLRVSHLHQDPISNEIQERIIQEASEALRDCDLLIFSDFNYGCLPQPLVDELIKIAKESNALVVADSQSSSQLGDIARFKSADLITPTEREARVSLKNMHDGIVVLCSQLKARSGAKNILLKLGQEGFIVDADRSNTNSSVYTDQIPALNSSPKDVAGAGDSMLTVSALVLSAGGSIWEAAALGAVAAAIQVGRAGNIPLNVEELTSELTK